MKEYKIGERFVENGIEYEVVEVKHPACSICDFWDSSRWCLDKACNNLHRRDGKNVVFKEIK